MDREEEKEVVDETQVATLENIIGTKDTTSIKVKIPKNEYNDEGKDGFTSEGNISSDGNNNKIKEKYGYTFNINGFESNSIAYFNEILLGNKTSSTSKCFNVKFEFEKEQFFKLSNSYEPILKYVLKIINTDIDLQGDIDGVITNVSNDTIKKAKDNNKYSIFTSNNFLKNNGKTYDIFCESTFGLINKLSHGKSEKTSRKIRQLKRLIFLIDFIKTINNETNKNSPGVQKNMKERINSLFHHNESNDIILCLIADGNYKKLIQQLKDSCLFAKQWNNKNENTDVGDLYTYFEHLRNSKLPFLIVYCPRFYERTTQYYNPLTKLYLEDDKNEPEIAVETLKNDNENLKKQIGEQNNKILDQNKKIEEQNKKIEELERQIKLLMGKKEGGENLLGKKTKRRKIFKKPKKKKNPKKDDKNDD